MTKLKLQFADNDGILSREEMKQVYGGYMSGSGDTGSGCYWYRCVCSEPESVMWGSTDYRRIQVYANESPETKLGDGCSGYKNVSCSKEQPCYPV
ncbi:hypothetical protein [uncultured Bacteroides sp.]|jgi:hypothetical protein|uniref:hypothetical protein n=1 Tax=uncultured Bacteroides sp. TaxID=162156 RepID=UPI0027DE13A0|nr:hypothetical protein [uncultured Bacteroides sp.]